MKHQLDDILDNCLADLLSGEVSLEEYMARYPEEASSLRPLLDIALQARGLELPEMEAAASGAAKRRMMAALDEKQRRELRIPLALRGFVARVGSLLSGPERSDAPLRGTLLVTAAIALAVILFTIMPGALFEVGRYDVVARTAVLADVAGVVEVQESAGGDWRPASSGIALNSGYHVRTGSLSSVSLMFFDASKTVLSSGTEVSLMELSSRRDGAAKTLILNQLVGQTENRVARMVDTSSRFEVRTPTLVAVVHGTEFSVNVAVDGTTSVSVREGSVGVTADGTTHVLAAGGQFASVPPPSPTAESSPTATWGSIEATDEFDKSELAGIARPTGTPDAGSGPDQTAASTATMTSSTTSAPEPTPTSDEVADDPDVPPDEEHPEHPEHPEQPTHPGLPDQAEPDVPPGRDPDRDKGTDKNK